MKVLFSLKGISNYFLAPYYLSGLIFTHFPLWPSRQICLRGFVLSGMPFSWTAAWRAPLLLSDLCSNATFISSCAAAAPQVLCFITLLCISLQHSTDHYLSDCTLDFSRARLFYFMCGDQDGTQGPFQILGLLSALKVATNTLTFPPIKRQSLFSH